MNHHCATCGIYACSSREMDNLPDHCPAHNEKWMNDSLAAYESEEVRRIAAAAAATEKEGYCKWPRLQEIAEFAHKAGFRRLGLAFCTGLRREAAIVARYYEKQGLEVISAICQCGAISKERIGVPEEAKFNPGEAESMCNPIGQAKIMNNADTEFNIVLGLCVGHDSLFFQYTEAPCTVLAAKDRVLGHNPLAAVYLSNSYYSRLHK